MTILFFSCSSLVILPELYDNLPRGSDSGFSIKGQELPDRTESDETVQNWNGSQLGVYKSIGTLATKIHRKFDFFSVRSIFISPNEQQKQYFHEWRSHE